MTTALGKSAHTRERLKSAATRLCRRDGFEKTTLRAIAAETGVSLGNAYYHFDSKAELAGAILSDTLGAFRSDALSRFGRDTGPVHDGEALEDRLRTAWGLMLDHLEPFAHSAPALVGAIGSTTGTSGAPAGGSLGSEGTADGIADVEDFYRSLSARARPQPPLAIRGDLPVLLVTCERVLLYAWARDRSPEQDRTRRLARRLASFVAKVAVLSRLPVVRSLLDDVVSMLALVR